jgi:two-component system sensor histidine kinase/response regulator
MEDPVNTQELWSRVGSDRALLSELLELFRQDYPAQIEAARKALAGAESEGVERAAHSLKGTLANLAATGACKLAAQLEDLGRSRQLGHANSTLTQLEREISRVTASLDILCQGGAG